MDTRRGSGQVPRRPSKLIWRRQYEAFCKKLVAARESAGMTQREAAEKLGRGQTYVHKCESGERRVDVVELKEFCRIYKKPLTFFA